MDRLTDIVSASDRVPTTEISYLEFPFNFIRNFVTLLDDPLSDMSGQPTSIFMIDGRYDALGCRGVFLQGVVHIINLVGWTIYLTINDYPSCNNVLLHRRAWV